MSAPIGKIPIKKIPAKLAAAMGGKKAPPDGKAAQAKTGGPQAPGQRPPGPVSRLSVLGRRPENIDEAAHAASDKRLFFWSLAAAASALIVWINVGTLDIVSMTMGEVIPSSQIKTIQHLEGGIVLSIAVREGQKVKKGEPLVELEQTSTGADVAELKIRLDALSIDIARLEAEAFGRKEPDFDDESMTKHPELVIQAMERFRVRQRTNKSKIASQEQTVLQRENEVKEIQARISRQREALKLQNEQIAISEELMKDQLTNRYLHLDLLKTANELSGRIREDTAGLHRAEAGLLEARNQADTIRSSYLEDVRKELDAARLEHRELSQRMTKFADSLRRTTLRSPVDGTIKTLHVATVGGVIKAGDPVVDIVPGEDRLVIESKLPTQDIGYVEVGQKVTVKLTSGDAARYGQLDGVVAGISPDTHLSPDGVPFYKVRVETTKSSFEHGNLRYHLYPGMQLSTNIRTGERTIFQYFFDPFLSSMGNAMQER